MKRLLLIFVFAMLIFTVLTGCNMENGIGSDEGNARQVFTGIGVDVKNDQNRIYHVVKDMNGFLYYSSDIEGAMAIVLDKDGKPTKDINTVTE